MRKSLIVIISLLFTLLLCLSVSATELAYGELEGIAIQDGYFPSPDDIISSAKYYSNNGSSKSTNTLDDYKDEILASWNEYSEEMIVMPNSNMILICPETPKDDPVLAVIQAFYSKLIDDNPEYFYVRSNFIFHYDVETKEFRGITPIYRFETHEIPDLVENFNAAVDTAISVIDDSMSDIDKMIALPDFIVLNAEYD